MEPEEAIKFMYLVNSKKIARYGFFFLIKIEDLCGKNIRRMDMKKTTGMCIKVMGFFLLFLIFVPLF